MRLSAGVTVIATTSEATTASAYEMTSGRKNVPVRLPSSATGTSAATMINVA